MPPGRARVRSFEELALPHAGALYRAAYHLTGVAADAEDLTQETYLRAFRAFGGFRGGNPKAWLFAILRHAFLDDCRRRRIAGPTEEIEAADAAASANGAAGPWLPSAEAEAVRDLPGEAVERALAALPLEWRLVVLLADVEDFSYREIAVVTGAPLGTVMSRLHRARRRLYEQLLDEAPVAGRGRERSR